MSYQLRLAHLYPEQMNIYGDRGNILTFIQRCRWRGIGIDVLPVDIGTSIDWNTVDLVFFGGGQDSGQAQIAEDFVQRQGPSLRTAIETGLVFLAICGGYQLLGHTYVTHTGEQLPGIGAFDAHTVGGHVRLIGNIVIESAVGNWDSAIDPESHIPAQPSIPAQLVGFENHSGRTYLGAGARPLGRVLTGYGNNGEDGSEGAIYRNMFGCYMHGSLLPKNPHFADHLITLALRRKYGSNAALAPLDDQLEFAAQRSLIERMIPTTT